MDQATLVSPDLIAGQEALSALDDADIDEIVALLVVFPEYGDWRLVLSSPSLDQSQQLKAYEQVTRALQGRFVYTLLSIMVLPQKDPFIQALRKRFKTKPKVATQALPRLTGQTVANRFIEDGYLLRLPGVIG